MLNVGIQKKIAVVGITVGLLSTIPFVNGVLPGFLTTPLMGTFNILSVLSLFGLYGLWKFGLFKAWW